MFRKKATHFFKFTQKIFHASFWHLFARPWDDNDVETQRFSGRSIAGTARPVSASKHRPAIRRAPFPTQPRRTARPQIIPPSTKTSGTASPSPVRPLHIPSKAPPFDSATPRAACRYPAPGNKAPGAHPRRSRPSLRHDPFPALLADRHDHTGSAPFKTRTFPLIAPKTHVDPRAPPHGSPHTARSRNHGQQHDHPLARSAPSAPPAPKNHPARRKNVRRSTRPPNHPLRIPGKTPHSTAPPTTPPCTAPHPQHKPGAATPSPKPPAPPADTTFPGNAPSAIPLPRSTRSAPKCSPISKLPRPAHPPPAA